jgi:hypothetical protein
MMVDPDKNYDFDDKDIVRSDDSDISEILEGKI